MRVGNRRVGNQVVHYHPLPQWKVRLEASSWVMVGPESWRSPRAGMYENRSEHPTG